MIFLITATLLALIYLLINYRLNYWNRRNVPTVRSSVFKEVISTFYFPTPFFDYFARMYTQLDGHKYGGAFQFLQPQLVIRDPEIIKHILVKDFEYFRDRGNVIYDEHDPITNHLFSSPAEIWRALRIRLTPTFTSGKMKFMFDTVKECAEECQQMLEKPATQGVVLNFKEVSTGYTIEVINSAAFGWKSNAINDSECKFKKISRTIFTSPLRFRMKLLIQTCFPYLKPYVNVSLLPPWVRDFFFDSVRETVEYRKKTGYKRNDFLQLLISLNETSENGNSQSAAPHSGNTELKLTNELMTAHCFLFFAAGYDTSSLILSMTLLEVAMNTDIQKRLQEEIDSVIAQNDDKITYEIFKEMPYLHKVVQETLRKYPVVSIITRISSKAYNIPGTDIVLEKGTEVVIPIAGMHRDPANYPNPDLFDPERFSDEEIRKRNHYTYLPFGEGPRNCIGSRFGMMTVKLGIIHILKKFNLEKTPKTVYPMTFRPYKVLTDCGSPLVLLCSLRN